MRTGLRLVRRWFHGSKWNKKLEMPRLIELKAGVPKIVFEGTPQTLNETPTPQMIADLLYVRSYDVIQKIFGDDPRQLVAALLSQLEEVTSAYGSVEFLISEIIKMLKQENLDRPEETAGLLFQLLENTFLLNFVLKNPDFVAAVKHFLGQIEPTLSEKLRKDVADIVTSGISYLEVDAFELLAEIHPLGDCSALHEVVATVEKEFLGYFVAPVFLRQLVSWLRFVGAHKNLPVFQAHSQCLAKALSNQMVGEKLSAIRNLTIRKLTCDVFLYLYQALPEDKKMEFLGTFSEFSDSPDELKNSDHLTSGVETMKARMVEPERIAKRPKLSRLSVPN